MKNLLILLGILLSSPFVVAQHSAINGNVAIANNSPEGTRVVVIKNQILIFYKQAYCIFLQLFLFF